MSWKNLKQQNFPEALLVNHAALTELDDVQEINQQLSIKGLYIQS